MRDIESDINLLDSVYELVEWDWGEESTRDVKELFDFIKELLKTL